MAGIRNRATPGVYITELNAFPPSVVGVQTAIPGFIGYTEKAVRDGKSITLKPIAITSLADYEQYFGTQFKPLYELAVLDPKAPDQNAWDLQVAGVKYTLKQEGSSKFFLYWSMRFFFDNGGSNCFVVSVGDYTASGQTPTGVPVQESDLEKGLESMRDQTGPTMLVVPDAMLLPSVTDFGTLSKKMLEQCSSLQDRVAIFDVYGMDTLTQANLAQDLPTVLSAFKGAVGSESLNYGMAYFPMLNTSVVQNQDVNYTYIDPTTKSPNASQNLLQYLLTQEANLKYKAGTPQMTTVTNYIAALTASTATPAYPYPTTPAGVLTLNQNLTNAIPAYSSWLKVILDKMNVLPPSGAMAGIFTASDNLNGVWNAPANMSVTSVVSCSVKINDAAQGDLNVPLDGKAIDVIRDFPSRGAVVWGARTLDGNSNDWRYIQVRRTIVYIEQSVKAALNPFVFAANDGQTWVAVTSMISNFLQTLWTQGGLMGDKASDAYTVQCGLGSTMTAQDILQGYMVVQITLQMIRPAEFIELTFKQQMQGA